MKLLVTGCAGRVGTAVTEHLVSDGHHVRGIDVVDTVDLDVDYRRCDLLDPEALKPQVDGVDAVLHLAAIPAPGRGPNADIFKLNTAGTFNVFDACAQAGVGRVVVASSINAIGYFFGAVPFEIDYLPVDEAHPKHTSDAYSFSKDVTEQIGDYFWRRDGISNACLRFGAGLRPIEEMRENAAGYVAVRALVEGLLGRPEEERTSEIARMRAAYDEERRARSYERRTGKTPDLAAEEHRLMTLRHNYFSFVALEDACRGMALSLTADYAGSHPLLIVDDHNTLMTGSEALAGLVYPDVRVTRELSGTESLVSGDRAREVIGFVPEVHASRLFE